MERLPSSVNQILFCEGLDEKNKNNSPKVLIGREFAGNLKKEFLKIELEGRRL